MKANVAAIATLAGTLFIGGAVEAATVTRGPIRNFVAKNSASLAKTDSTQYVQVSKMKHTMSTKEDGPMLVTYCAESAVDTDGGTIYVRLSVDNRFSPSFSIFGQGAADGEYSSQCVQWSFTDVPAGSHTVQVDYRATVGMAYQYYKSLTIQYHK